MIRQAALRASLTALAGLALGEEAAASGFALREQSTTSQGSAFAGSSAGRDDPSFMFANPAALAWSDRAQAQLVLTAIMPHSELDNAAGDTVLGSPIQGRDSRGDVTPDTVLPAFYLAAPVGSRVRLGLGVNTPYGLSTDYPNNWVGRYHGVENHVRTVDINPAIALKVTDRISVGFGLQAQWIDGSLEDRVDFGTIGAASGVPGSAPGAQDGKARLDGDDWGFGYTLGMQVEPIAGTRLGVGYRSKIKHTLRGDVDFSEDQAGVANVLRGFGLFQDGNARLDVDTPETVSLGLEQEIGHGVALLGEVQWTGWSSFDELRVKYDNPNQPDSVTEENWRDTWFYAVGVRWQAQDTLTLRVGAAYDQSPVRNRYRTPRIPDDNRRWLSAGVAWTPRPWLSVDAVYSHIWVGDSRVDLSASDEGNTFRGDLKADYDISTDFVGLSARLSF